MAEELKVGGELDAWCTSCKLMKWHTIVALVGNKPAKVECQGCHKQHQYRAAPPGTSTGGSGASGEKKPRASKAAAAAAAPAVDFDALVGGRAGEARPYSPDTKYALGDLVQHPTFEIGVVTAVPGNQKVEITFRGSKKILLHDRGGATPSKLGPAPRREEAVQPTGTSDSPRGQK
jgi:hypothetical protein